MKVEGFSDPPSPSPDFLYPLVHDLRATLRALEMSTTMLEEEAREEVQGRSLRSVQRIWEVTHTLKSVADGLSKLARAATPPRQTLRVDLFSMAAELLSSLRALGWTPTVQIIGRVHASGDRAHFELLLSELLRNAWLATRGLDEPHLRLEAVPTRGAAAFLLTDNGIGLPPLTDPRELFSPFRLFRPRSQWPGIGLGLYTVRTILRHYRGCITLTPVQQGTQVLCTLAE